MKFFNQALDRFSSFGLVITRVLLGVLFIIHGLDKFEKGFSEIGGMFDAWGVPAAETSAAVVAVLEIALGVALAVGAGTRVSALILAVLLLGAIYFAKIDSKILGHAEVDMAYLSGLVALILVGPGKYSLDRTVGFESNDD